MTKKPEFPFVPDDFQIGPEGAYIHHDYKFKIGDKAYKPKGYKFPCTIVSVFETTSAQVRVVAEMEEYGLLHIFNEDQLEHFPFKWFSLENTSMKKI